MFNGFSKRRFILMALGLLILGFWLVHPTLIHWLEDLDALVFPEPKDHYHLGTTAVRIIVTDNKTGQPIEGAILKTKKGGGEDRFGERPEWEEILAVSDRTGTIKWGIRSMWQENGLFQTKTNFRF